MKIKNKMNFKNNNDQILEVNIKTWKDKSDGIFHYKKDFSSYNIVQSGINKNSYFIRGKNNIIKIKENQSEFDNNKDGEILFYARKSFKTGLFELINPVKKRMIKNPKIINNLNNRLWYILKSKKEYNEIDNEDYNINENDIIKLGRKKYEVIKKNIISYNNLISYENKDNYNISEMNKRIGSIFDINLKPNQYNITEKEFKKEEKEIKIKENEVKNNISMPFFSNILSKKVIDNQTNKIDLKKNFENFNVINENEDIEGEKCRICFEVKSTKNNPKLYLC